VVGAKKMKARDTDRRSSDPPHDPAPSARDKCYGPAGASAVARP
jgi:hypothetical protein